MTWRPRQASPNARPGSQPNPRTGTGRAGEVWRGAVDAVPDAARSADNGVQQWRQPNFEALWGASVRTDEKNKGVTYGMMIQDSMKSGDFGHQLSDLAAKFDSRVDAPGWSHLHPKEAYKNGFLAEMQGDPHKKIQRIIDYDPGRGTAWGGEMQATMQDLDRLQKQGMADQQAGKKGAGPDSRMEGLTFEQRVRYVENLESFKGVHTGNLESWRIYDMFKTAPAGDRRKLYQRLEGHAWDGSFTHGITHINDDLWDSLDKTIIDALEKLLNESP